MKGWISLHRKIKNNIVWADPNYLKLWIYCLLEASHKEHDQLVGNQIVKLKKGEFVTGRFSLNEQMNKGVKPKLRLDERTWWRHLQNLEKWQMLTIKSTNKFSIVTLANYEIYQDGLDRVDQVIDQQLTNSCPSNDQQLTTNNNGNKGNNDNKENTTQQIKDLRSRFSDKQLIVIDEYLDILKHTRRSAKIADSVILKMYQEWQKHRIEAVIYALDLYNSSPRLHDKKENYCYGIMRNATPEEIEKRREEKRNNKSNVTPIKAKQKTKFHLAESRGDKYSAEELEEIILKKPKRAP